MKKEKETIKADAADAATGDGEALPVIEYVWMRRITDNDGPHPIHPDEVQNYISGDWVVVEVEN